MSALSIRLTRRQFVASASAVSLGLLTAPAFRAAAASVESGPSAIPVRVGRVVHSGLAFRDGELRGVTLPSRGGSDGSLTSTETGGQYLSTPIRLDFPATHAGLHWATDGDLARLEVGLRFSRDGLAWSPWRRAQVEHHARDEAGPETYSTLFGLRGAAWVQYRLTFGDPPGAGGVASVGLAYLDAGVSRPIDGATADRRSFTARRGPTTLLDRVITREQWGADESIRFSDGRDLWPRAYVTPKLLVVHHTATDNDYADPAAEIRAIYTYHTVVQEFGDIGYHLLIDNRGQVYEGRRGREVDPDLPGQREIVSANVVAGHTLGFNYGSAGIAVLGTFVDEAPSDAALESLTEALAFEAHRAGLDPTARTDVQRLRGTVGADVFWRDDLAIVSGHRDCIETECPGDQLYVRLSQLRQSIAGQLGAAGPGAQITRSPTNRMLWPQDLVFAWEAQAGANEFSTRLEGFILSTTPDLIVPLSGYMEDERERWSEWSRSRELSIALPPNASGVYTLMVRARDGRGSEGRVYARRAYEVGRRVVVDDDDRERTQRAGVWEHATQPLNFYGRGYAVADPESGPAGFTWALRAPETGTYRVQACWTSGELRASNARFRAQVNGVERINVTVDQRERGGAWVELGRLALGEGAVCDVLLNNEADGSVAADAVRLVMENA